MFVGHALVAFAVVAVAARWRGWNADRALRAGVLAGLFATVPDLDILYGPVGLLGGFSGIADAAATFWASGNVVHRGPTHSMLVGAVAATAFGAWRSGRRATRAAAAALAVCIVAAVFALSGLLGAVVTAVFLTGGFLVATLAGRWRVPASTVTVLALVGLLTHPLGDLFTGTPPALLYPLNLVVVSERVVLHPDPTVNLLAAFGVELFVVWTALVVAFSLMGRSVRSHVDRRALLGVAYAATALALPAPTLDASYHFVFSVLALGFVGVSRRSLRRTDLPRLACTALAAVTFAAAGYGVAYLLI